MCLPECPWYLKSTLWGREDMQNRQAPLCFHTVTPTHHRYCLPVMFMLCEAQNFMAVRRRAAETKCLKNITLEQLLKSCWIATKLEKRKASSEMNYAFRNVHGFRPICTESDPNRTLDRGFSFLALLSWMKIKTFWMMFSVICCYMQWICYSGSSMIHGRKNSAQIWSECISYCFHSSSLK